MNVDQICLVTLAVIALALALMGRNYSSIKKKKSHKFGEDDLKKIPTEYRKDASYFGRDVQDGMLDLSRTIRSGAKTFMLTEYKTIIIVVLILAVVFSFLIEASSGLTFLLGALMSSLACIIGMVGAVYANYRVARRAFKSFSVGRTVKTALKGGSISGLSVESFGLLGLIIVVLFFGIDFVPQDGHGLIVELINSFRGHNSFVGLSCNPTTMRLTTYSLGCSLVAMFNRVAGGNFTKAADISADIVAKVRHDMPEDDARMPNTIADFIGDNVNDIAGNCSDLLESFVATIVASLLISNLVFKGSGASVSMLNATITFPLALAAIGLLSCIIGLIYSLFRKNNGGNDPSKALDMTTYISAAVTIIGSAFAAKFIFDGIDLYGSFHAKWASPWVASIFGIASGVLVGKITEYYTDTKYTPVKSLAAISPEGEAFVATKGDAIGSRSTLPNILVIGISLIISWAVCGTYGIAIAALGMLSFVATTVSIDAFGPIADNAGGIVEGVFGSAKDPEDETADDRRKRELGEQVRTITDKLDATGNTTAAIGKGFAIGSAAYATVSLILAYVGGYSSGEAVLNIASPMVIVGALIGGALVEYFSAMLTDNTIESAKAMAKEGDKQLTPAVMAGIEKPDYNTLIEMATRQALRKMLVPSLLALFIPVLGGFICGVEFVGGLLIGATIVAIPRAIFMGNSGGAFDNAKKYVEQGLLEGYGKGSAAHKATVVGDTIGDTRKDVVGVALDIFIKTMSTVANTLSPIFASVHLF